MAKDKTVKVRKGYGLMLKTVNANMTASCNGKFKYPKSGSVKCTDWNNAKECGGGLHGLPWGVGAADLLALDKVDAKWLVIEYREKSAVVIDSQKIKVPSGRVVFCGAKDGALAYLDAHGADKGKRIFGSASNSGYSGSASNSGYRGSASNSGDRGSASNSGDSGSASNSGYRGSASNSGDSGSASNSGDRGSASNSGDSGVAIAFNRVRATANSTLIIRWHDGKRARVTVGYPGEDGILPDKWYSVNDKGELILSFDQSPIRGDPDWKESV